MALFNKAKTSATKKTKTEKRLVSISGSEFDQALYEAATLDAQIKNLTAKLNAAKNIVKVASVQEWKNIYNKEGINSGSFNIESENGHTCQFIPTTKFGKISEEETYNDYVETYGAENLTEETTYSFNSKILEKNQEAIEKAIMESDISEDDKENLLDANTKWQFKSTCLDKVKMLAKDANLEIDDVLEDLSPVVYPKLFKANLK